MRVLVIGGGAIGAAVALFLKRLGGASVDVQVAEPDPTLARSSSALSAGSVRQQFSNAVNVQMSSFGHPVELPAGNPSAYSRSMASHESSTVNTPSTGIGTASRSIPSTATSPNSTSASFASLTVSQSTNQHRSAPNRRTSSSRSFRPASSASTAIVIFRASFSASQASA